MSITEQVLGPSFFNDELPEYKKLERRKRIIDIMKTHPSSVECDTFFLRTMSKRLYPSDITQAYELCKGVEPYTTAQAGFIGISVEEFVDLHTKVQYYLQTKGSDEKLYETMLAYATQNNVDGAGYIWNDNHEISQENARGLDVLRQKGIQLSIPDDKIHILQLFQRNAKPLIESAKNERIAKISSFTDVLVSVLVHDIYDHLFAFDLIDNEGLIERYKDFFHRIGNPQNTDLFSREGELTASAVYSFRQWIMLKEEVRPPFTVDRLIRLIQRSKAQTENQRRVQSLLRVISEDDREANRVGFIVSSVLCYMMRLRRKQGFIRELDQDFNPVGIFPLVDPEYISLIVELSHNLSRNEKSTISSLINVSVLIEEYLEMVANRLYKRDDENVTYNHFNNRLRYRVGSDVPELIISLNDVKDPSIVGSSNIPVDRLSWIMSNPGNTALEYYI